MNKLYMSGTAEATLVARLELVESAIRTCDEKLRELDKARATYIAERDSIRAALRKLDPDEEWKD